MTVQSYAYFSKIQRIRNKDFSFKILINKKNNFFHKNIWLFENQVVFLRIFISCTQAADSAVGQ
jgi:hypothetical protein